MSYALGKLFTSQKKKMSTYKYLSTFPCQMEAAVYLYCINSLNAIPPYQAECDFSKYWVHHELE